ncbi:hypothetical protein HDA43_005796 [Streptosporangium sandarakinum]|uniref:Uncharacterized protein n=1 Tax=Streptosporangium sandarakinum TaxID=1260955 RepID=A0A852V515_9ACTN|nr:hypothetical protein [Streptosporangium sandarakinum]
MLTAFPWNADDWFETASRASLSTSNSEPANQKKAAASCSRDMLNCT